MRSWIEIEWEPSEADPDGTAGQAIVTGVLDALLGVLTDDPDVIDPSVSVTLRADEAIEWTL